MGLLNISLIVIIVSIILLYFLYKLTSIGIKDDTQYSKIEGGLSIAIIKNIYNTLKRFRKQCIIIDKDQRIISAINKLASGVISVSSDVIILLIKFASASTLTEAIRVSAKSAMLMPKLPIAIIDIKKFIISIKSKPKLESFIMGKIDDIYELLLAMRSNIELMNSLSNHINTFNSLFDAIKTLRDNKSTYKNLQISPFDTIMKILKNIE